jgi:hypothetical protein
MHIAAAESIARTTWIGPAAHESEHQPAGEWSIVGVVLNRRTNGDDRLYVPFSNPALKHALDGVARIDQPFTFQNATPSACHGSLFPAAFRPGSE